MVFYRVLCISRVSLVVVFSVIPWVVGADGGYCSGGGGDSLRDILNLSTFV